jgi:hypothetical protein
MDSGHVKKSDIIEACTTLDALREDFPGQVVLTTDEIAQALGKRGTGGPQTIRNQIASGAFPLADKLRKIGGNWVLPMAALADWLDGKADAAPLPAMIAKKKPGRPRKALTEWMDALEASWQRIYFEDVRDLLDAEAREANAPPRDYHLR